jgi:hypothetical protein
MGDWLARATQGVDLTAPGAFWQIFGRLLQDFPWAAMFWWNLVFVAVGALLGWWRGRIAEGIVWGLVLGPVGWIVVVFRRRPPQGPPSLPR